MKTSTSGASRRTPVKRNRSDVTSLNSKVPNQCHVLPLGDLVFGLTLIASFTRSVLVIASLAYLGLLRALRCNGIELKSPATYTCPITWDFDRMAVMLVSAHFYAKRHRRFALLSWGPVAGVVVLVVRTK